MKKHEKSTFWEEGSEDFEVQIFLVSDAVCAALDDADLVVRALDKAEADFIVHFTVGNNAIPVAFDHVGELFKWAQALPAELGLPVVEKLPGPGWVLIAPKVDEGFFEQVGLEQSRIGIEESFERFTAFTAQIVSMAEQGVALAFDEASIFLAEAEVFLTADLVDGIIEVAQDMKFVVDDSDVRAKADDVCKRLPHVHHRQPDFRGFPRAQPAKEKLQILFAASLASEPDEALALQIADDDAINVPFADGDFIDADGARGRCSSPIHQLLKALFFQILDRVPVQPQQAAHARNRLLPTHPANVHGETPGKVRVLCQPLQTLGFHLATDRTLHPTNFQFQVNALFAAIQVADGSNPLVIMGMHLLATSTTKCFFARRSNMTIRACGSPHTPCKRRTAWKPGKQYNCCNVRPVFMRQNVNQNSRHVHTTHFPS